ncbi:ribosome small subunit-dependent GTPase A [Dethiosulfovibrio salsuginis]|uniref:Small ribosomal subunit biogenesis GTPase RsgA n=1 Tax=Dethiosulfovibrio salsuginis TaxID=561720 RepID=A0A1X7JKN8_9BACT|nr:ribosome small subunit-dependent GTPase A [Dethiosulfovibrio salsuginis]SMG28747.1 ribosome biogenesis GTPase [Dethiosulfovibrio salsuginis]
MSIDISKFGFTENLKEQSALYPGLFPGRVISQHKHFCRVVTEKGEVNGVVSGRFRFEVHSTRNYPAVGDFVMLDRECDDGGDAIIHAILPRKTAFIRKAAGTSRQEQVVASNIDTVFVCMSLNNDYNLRRLERYLGVAWDSGATPVVVLTKADLCQDLPSVLSELKPVLSGAEVLVTSSLMEDGYESVKKYLAPGMTVALIGSSGVGKSTLINRLLGVEILLTQGIRDDHKGRHTTTVRELMLLPSGAMVIDTPGMKELGIDGVDLARAFSDIEELANGCRFRDCSHGDEPHCAVQKAIADGILSADRFASYLKLKKEARYDGLNPRQVETEKMSSMFKDVGGMKNARKFAKAKNRSKGR